MTGTEHKQHPRVGGERSADAHERSLRGTEGARRRPGLASLAALGAAGGLAITVAGLALAASSAPTVSALSNSKLKEKIVVNAQGHTLYVLSPETTSHLLCKSSECLKFWPPLKVSSSKAKLVAGSGVHGKLGIFRRGKDLFQVTLRGLPVYTFSGDKSKGQVNGENLKSFGGTWHVVTATGDPPHASGQSGSGASTPSSSGSPGGYGNSGSGGYGGNSGGGGGSTEQSWSTTSSYTTSPTSSTTTSQYSYSNSNTSSTTTSNNSTSTTTSYTTTGGW